MPLHLIAQLEIFPKTIPGVFAAILEELIPFLRFLRGDDPPFKLAFESFGKTRLLILPFAEGGTGLRP